MTGAFEASTGSMVPRSTGSNQIYAHVLFKWQETLNKLGVSDGKQYEWRCCAEAILNCFYNIWHNEY